MNIWGHLADMCAISLILNVAVFKGPSDHVAFVYISGCLGAYHLWLRIMAEKQVVTGVKNSEDGK